MDGEDTVEGCEEGGLDYGTEEGGEEAARVKKGDERGEAVPTASG